MAELKHRTWYRVLAAVSALMFLWIMWLLWRDAPLILPVRLTLLVVVAGQAFSAFVDAIAPTRAAK